jgi:hypothetical protein
LCGSEPSLPAATTPPMLCDILRREHGISRAVGIPRVERAPGEAAGFGPMYLLHG